jgi:hypothetical protein
LCEEWSTSADAGPARHRACAGPVHDQPAEVDRAHRPRRRPGAGRDRRQRPRHPRSDRRPHPGALLHHQAGRPAPAWGSTSAGGSSSSATTATCASPQPPAAPASRCCCRSPRAGDPPGLDRLAQVPAVGGDRPDHEDVQGDDDDQRPERVVGEEQEVGDGAKHGQGDGRGTGPGPPRQQPQPAKATSSPRIRWIQPQVVASNWNR